MKQVLLIVVALGIWLATDISFWWLALGVLLILVVSGVFFTKQVLASDARELAKVQLLNLDLLKEKYPALHGEEFYREILKRRPGLSPGDIETVLANARTRAILGNRPFNLQRVVESLFVFELTSSMGGVHPSIQSDLESALLEIEKVIPEKM